MSPDSDPDSSHARGLAKLQRYLAQKVLPVQLLDPTTQLLDLSLDPVQDDLARVIQTLLTTDHDTKAEEIETETETETEPEAEYFRVYLKLLTRRLEQSNIQVGEALTELYMSLILQTQSSSSTPGMGMGIAAPLPSVVRYYYTHDNSGHVLLHEQPAVISAQGGTGHRTWEAALALTDFLLTPDPATKASLDRTQRVVELGAGTGLVGLVAARVLPSVRQVVLTDGDDGVVDKLQANIVLNPFTTDTATGKQPEVSATRFFWGEDKPSAPTDLVLAADVTYDASVIPHLVTALSDFLTPIPPATTPPQVLVAATIRSEATFAVFAHECSSRGIELEVARRYDTPVQSEWFWVAPTSAPVVIYSLARRG